MPPSKKTIGHNAPISGLALTDDGSIYSADVTGLVLAWQAANGALRAPRKLVQLGSAVNALTLHQNKLWLLHGDELSGLSLGTRARNGPSLSLPQPMHLLSRCADRLVLANDKHALVFAWEKNGWSVERKIALPKGSSDELDLSHDGQRFLIIKDGRHLTVFDAEQGTRLGGFSSKQDEPISARFDNDSDYVFRACEGSYGVRRVRWRSGRGKLELHARAAWNISLQSSADGGHLAALSRGNAVQLWSLRRPSYYADRTN